MKARRFKPVKVTTPYPTTEEIAREYGLSKKEVKYCENLVFRVLLDNFIRRLRRLLRRVNRKYAVMILEAGEKYPQRIFANLSVIESLVQNKKWLELEVMLALDPGPKAKRKGKRK